LDPEPSNILAFLFDLPWGVILNTILVFILLLCSALISGAEVAFFSLSQHTLEECAEDKDANKNLVASK
jgi:CBS domain containing-hemolysin-like protein